MTNKSFSSLFRSFAGALSVATLLLLNCSLSHAQKFSLPVGGYTDGVRVLLLGNSFTYFHDCDSMLVQIGRSQGVKVCIGEYLKGGMTFGQHLNHPSSGEAIAAGNYKVAFIQDYSNAAALYAKGGRDDILECTKLLKERILQASPSCRIILERTWSFEGDGAGGFKDSSELDSYIEKGSRKIARKTHLERSPIGDAFNLCRELYPDIDLLSADRKHQSRAGSYLKVCVNFLLVTGTPFSGDVASCGLPKEDAERLREVASKTVLK